MPAAIPLSADEQDLVEQYCAELRLLGLRPWRSTRSAAETFSRRLRNNGWEKRNLNQQLAMVKISHAVPFASWLIVTGRLQVNACFLVAVGLRLGHAAALYQPVAYERFRQAAAPLETRPADVRLQWHALVLVGAAVGRTVDQIDDDGFTTGRAELLSAYRERDCRNAGRNPSAILHRLQTTLFHGEIIETIARPSKPGIRETGWRGIAVGYSEAAQRYLDQVTVSLRPSTLRSVERDLRGFGHFLAEEHPEIHLLNQLTRVHIEAYKARLQHNPAAVERRLARSTIRNTLINLRCFFTRITEWGYADVPARPLIFDADLPIADRPLPRFLDDPAATKLARAGRAEPDPFARLVVELLARTGMRKGELLALTMDAVVQIGSAYWLRVPLGKLHTDRYIPLHPDLQGAPGRLDRPAAVGSAFELTLFGTRAPGESRPRGPRPGSRRCGSRHRARYSPPTPSHAGHSGHQSWHEPRCDCRTARAQTLAMTMVYARIADRTVANEYFAVTEKVEALYGQPAQLPADDEGHEMRRLRAGCTDGCSAMATARDPSKWTATSSPSANRAPSSLQRGIFDRHFRPSETTRNARDRWAANASSTAYYTASRLSLHESASPTPCRDHLHKYNQHRRHSTLGYRSPAEVERRTSVGALAA